MPWYGWCTESLEDHSRAVLSFARGAFSVRSHRCVVEMLNSLRLDVAMRDEIYGRISNDIRRVLDATCRRIGVVLGVNSGIDVLEDLVSLALALHDVGKASDVYVSNVVKALEAGAGVRCHCSKDRLLKIVEDVEQRLREFYHRLGKVRGTPTDLDEFLAMLREYISSSSMRFGCPLEGAVCPLTFVFEVYLEYISKHGILGTRYLELAYTILVKKLRRSCICFVRPSFVGHELLSAYIVRELLYRTLRELDGIPWARNVRNVLSAILSISVLLHHHAMRSLEEAIERISSYSAITLLSIDENIRSAIVNILKNVEDLFNDSKTFSTVLSIVEKLPSLEISLPTFLDYILSVDEELKNYVRLYTVTLAPLCKSDTLASYVCRRCGAPTYLAKEAILRSLR